MADTDPKAVFSDVDSSGIAQELMVYLDRVAAIPQMRDLRRATYRALELRPGHVVVDVGCGLGHAVAEMADLVGPDGRVMGLDLSAGMAAEAERRMTAAQAEIRQGDLLALDLSEASVDGARVERVFQHVRELEQGVAELARVIRPGGRVVVLDTDWTSMRVVGTPPEITHEVSDAWFGGVPRPTAVLDLPTALANAGFTAISMEPTVLLHDSVASAARTIVSFDRDVPAEHWPYDEATGARWFAALDEAEQAGRFFCAVTMWQVAGRRG